jgi:ElaB/YqjD/DUF883 family membrane-anchored ribosome-binding protein
MNKSITRLAWLPYLLTACLLLLSPGLYADDNTGTDWDQLDLAQQQLLQQYRNDWNNIPEQRRQMLATGAQRWNDMTPEQRERAQRSLKRWKQLTPEQQAKIRERIKAFRELPLELRQSLRAKYQWYKELPPERQQALRERWGNLTTEEKAQVHERLRNLDPAQLEQLQQRNDALGGSGNSFGISGPGGDNFNGIDAGGSGSGGNPAR